MHGIGAGPTWLRCWAGNSQAVKEVQIWKCGWGLPYLMTGEEGRVWLGFGTSGLAEGWELLVSQWEPGQRWRHLPILPPPQSSWSFCHFFSVVVFLKGAMGAVGWLLLRVFFADGLGFTFVKAAGRGLRFFKCGVEWIGPISIWVYLAYSVTSRRGYQLLGWIKWKTGIKLSSRCSNCDWEMW